ncbi:MAG: hypothetical protein AAF703_15980 [Cyanobacteria bacterium P01_D01_bin.105]
MKALLFGGFSALLVASAGILDTTPVSAQVFSSQRNAPVNQPINSPASQSSQPQNQRVAQGNTALRTTLKQQGDTLYLNKDKTYEYDLILRSESAINGQRLPVGAIIRGRFEPAEGGLVYVADSVELGDRIVRINAVSELLRDRKDPRQTSTGAILTDAAIGAAGGYVLGEVLGDAGVIEVLGGAAAGVVVGNTTAPFVVVIRPEDQIVLYSN